MPNWLAKASKHPLSREKGKKTAAKGPSLCGRVWFFTGTFSEKKISHA
jgi:hypothetical protein